MSGLGRGRLPDGLHPLPAVEEEVMLSPLARAVADGFGATCNL
jgi:hypothetical protein